MNKSSEPYLSNAEKLELVILKNADETSIIEWLKKNAATTDRGSLLVRDDPYYSLRNFLEPKWTDQSPNLRHAVAFLGRDESNLAKLFIEGDKDTRAAIVQNPVIGCSVMEICGLQDWLRPEKRIDFRTIYQQGLLEYFFMNFALNEEFLGKCFAREDEFSCIKPALLDEGMMILMPSRKGAKSYFSDFRNHEQYVYRERYRGLIEAIINFYLQHISRDRPEWGHVYRFDKFLETISEANFRTLSFNHMDALDFFSPSSLRDSIKRKSEEEDFPTIGDMYFRIQSELARYVFTNVRNECGESESIDKRMIFYRHASIKRIFSLNCPFQEGVLPLLKDLRFSLEHANEEHIDNKITEQVNPKPSAIKTVDDLLAKTVSVNVDRGKERFTNALNAMLIDKPIEFFGGLIHNREWYLQAWSRDWLKHVCKEFDGWGVGFDERWVYQHRTAVETFEVLLKSLQQQGGINLERERLDLIADQLNCQTQGLLEVRESIEVLKSTFEAWEAKTHEGAEDSKSEIDDLRLSLRSMGSKMIREIKNVNQRLDEPQDITTKFLYGIPILGRILKNIFR
jgi:hypothetical protein